jgi:hypothetical protein
MTAEESDDATFQDITGALRSAQDEIAILRTQCQDHDNLKLRCAHLEVVFVLLLNFAASHICAPLCCVCCFASQCSVELDGGLYNMLTIKRV